MNGWKKLLCWLKKPHGIPLVLIYLLTIGACSGAIVLAMLEERAFPFSILAYVVYGVAAITLGYSVYTIVRVIPKAKRNITGRLQKFSFTNRLLEQYGFRTVIFSIGAFAINVAYVVFNGVIGIIERSIWYGALASYYLLLVVMRGGVLSFHRAKRRHAEMECAERKRRELKIYRNCGIGLVVLPFCLSFAILQMVRGVNSFEHAGMMIYVSAIYAFYKITMSIINLFKARKNDDRTVRAIRCINLADAFVSILALQTAMFKEFSSGENVGFANALTGAVVCLLTALLGIYMIVSATVKQKEESNDERTGQ